MYFDCSFLLVCEIHTTEDHGDCISPLTSKQQERWQKQRMRGRIWKARGWSVSPWSLGKLESKSLGNWRTRRWLAVGQYRFTEGHLLLYQPGCLLQCNDGFCGWKREQWMFLMSAWTSRVADYILARLWRCGLDGRTAEWVEKTAGPLGLVAVNHLQPVEVLGCLY